MRAFVDGGGIRGFDRELAVVSRGKKAIAQGKRVGYHSGRSNPYTRSRMSEAAAARMAEHDGTGAVVSRRAAEDVDKDADVTPM